MQLSQALGDRLVFDLALHACDVVALLVLNQVVAYLHVLRDHEVLLLEDLVLLRRLQLENRVFNLGRKVAEDEIVRSHELLHTFRCDLHL